MTPLDFVVGLGMIGVGVGAIVWWRRSSGAALSVALAGMGTWLLAVVLKFVPGAFTPALDAFVRSATPTLLAEPLLWAYSGLLTAIFECGVVLLLARFEAIRTEDWDDAVAFGIGFGAAEAILVGLVSVAIVVVGIWMPELLPESIRNPSIPWANSTWAAPFPLLERAATLGIHALSCVLVLLTVETGDWKWFWIAFAYKTLTDGLAGVLHVTYGGVSGLSATEFVTFELAILILGALGIWGLTLLHEQWPNDRRR